MTNEEYYGFDHYNNTIGFIRWVNKYYNNDGGDFWIRDVALFTALSEKERQDMKVVINNIPTVLHIVYFDAIPDLYDYWLNLEYKAVKS